MSANAFYDKDGYENAPTTVNECNGDFSPITLAS
jgi:hypothetical protein